MADERRTICILRSYEGKGGAKGVVRLRSAALEEISPHQLPSRHWTYNGLRATVTFAEEFNGGYPPLR
jgi:hypothetical protein